MRARLGPDGRPVDPTYLECGLPAYLQRSLDAWKACRARLEAGEADTLWDCRYCELQSDINVAEVDGDISPRAAWHLRERYLGIAKEDVT